MRPALEGVLRERRLLLDQLRQRPGAGDFLRGGDEAKPLHFRVHRDFDGRSFANRRVVVRQDGKVIGRFRATGVRPRGWHGQDFGESARTHFRVETEYEFLLTNRLILQPLVELEIYGKSDQERGIGAGLSSAEAGLRLRYELRRELAPYVGLAWDRKFFGTADLAEAAGDEIGGARLALGIRAWF